MSNNKGLIQQMQDADLGTLSEIGGEAAKLIEAAFDTIPSKKPRTAWYGPLGLVKSEGKKVMVCNDGKKYHEATEEELVIWKEFLEKLKP